MDIFIARQPIYDRNLKVFAYELLYRHNAEANGYAAKDPTLATISVIVDAFLNIGIETLTNKKPGFVNFTGDLLICKEIKVLPAEYLGIEILERTESSETVLRACEELKALGYTIALDDYVYTEASAQLIPYADIIKMDFIDSSDQALREIVHRYKKEGVRFLAEKVETPDEYLKALSYGYDYFQGYYFEKPTLIRKKNLQPLQVNALKVFEILQEESCDIQSIAAIINSDPGMAYKLFRLANSVMYGGRNRIINALSAIVRIGLKDLQVWVLYIMLYGTNQEKPDELIRKSMFRAWVAEELCVAKNLSQDVAGFSLLGLFSLLDVIMDTPFETILSHITIDPAVTRALTNPGDDSYGAAIRMICAYDQGAWEEAKEAGDLIGVSLSEYQEIYVRAIKRCDAMLNGLGFV